MKKFKSRVQKLRKALETTTEPLQNATCASGQTDPATSMAENLIQIARPPDGDSSTSLATSNSPFFKVLPLELRLHILNTALGGRTVHIGYGELPAVQYAQQRQMYEVWDDHCAWQSRRAKCDGGKTWFGCVCHRFRGDDFGANLVHDRCLEGRADCYAFHGEIPHKCWVGALGWLLTCRQAYWEGHEVLYSNNTFHLQPNTPQTWPADYLSHPAFQSIKSLELVAFTSRPHITLTHAEDIIQIVPSTYPSLQRLYIAFDRGLYGIRPEEPKETYLDFTEDMLPVLDQLARRYQPGALELEVGVPESVFHASFWLGLRGGSRFQGPNWTLRPGRLGEVGGLCERKRIWRTVRSTEKEKGGGDVDFGYWLSETRSDMPNAWMVTMSRYWE